MGVYVDNQYQTTIVQDNNGNTAWQQVSVVQVPYGNHDLRLVHVNGYYANLDSIEVLKAQSTPWNIFSIE